MGYQIIKQPDGLLAVFDSSGNTIPVWDASPEEIADWFADQAADQVRAQAIEAARQVAAGRPEKVYSQFVMSWEEALGHERRSGGSLWREFEES